jgi:Tat protein secretion system quality control protein TatD with DNase activity
MTNDGWSRHEKHCIVGESGLDFERSGDARRNIVVDLDPD